MTCMDKVAQCCCEIEIYKINLKQPCRFSTFTDFLSTFGFYNKRGKTNVECIEQLCAYSCVTRLYNWIFGVGLKTWMRDRCDKNEREKKKEEKRLRFACPDTVIIMNWYEPSQFHYLFGLYWNYRPTFFLY